MCCYHTKEEVDNFQGRIIFVVKFHEMTCQNLMPEAGVGHPRTKV
jgi:hypothetical protein